MPRGGCSAGFCITLLGSNPPGLDAEEKKKQVPCCRGKKKQVPLCRGKKKVSAKSVLDTPIAPPQ